MSKNIGLRTTLEAQNSTDFASDFSHDFAAKQPETSRLQRLARKWIFKLLSGVENASLTVIEGDKISVFGDKSAPLSASVSVHRPQFYVDVLLRGDIAFGEAFGNQDITTPNVTQLVRVLVRQQAMLKRLVKFNFFTGHLFSRTVHRLRKNSVKGSKKNIMAHYDLGNEFFQTFLDETMMYSSAIYTASSQSLACASLNKLQTICDNLKLSADDHVLEIGTGWGGFAVYAAKNYGCKVTTTTISQAQFSYAKNAVKTAGVEHLVTLLDSDYRHLSGKYDKVVSIEMIEAVGHQYLPHYLRKINALTKKGGKVLLQAIMLPDQKYDRARYHADFIKTHIFPGGFLPSVGAITASTKAHTSLNLINYFDMTQSYAYTLRDWRQRFDSAETALETMGYPETFRRLWHFYLAYCEGGFEERAIYCGQLLFEKHELL